MTMTRMILAALLMLGLGVAAAGWGQPATTTPGAAPYQESFEKAAVGKVPEGMLVLGGEFAVRAAEGNQVLELPGTPLPDRDTFGVLFGPTAAEGLSVSLRVQATAQGRRYPSFGVGLGGVGGHRLRLAPAAKALELVRDDLVLTKVRYEGWASGKWTNLRLQITPGGEGKWLVAGKAWPAGEAEPAEWMIRYEEKEPPSSGRPSLWGAPYSEQPIRYDDLRVEKAR